MPEFYLVNGIGGGFDGLVVEASSLQEGSLVEVHRLINTNIVIGDRHASTPVVAQSVYLSKKFLEPAEDPTGRQFDHQSPYGEFKLEGQMSCGNLQVSYSQFENALQVSVAEVEGENRKTLFNQNFSKNFDQIKSVIEQTLKEGTGEDLIFKLRELKEAEAHG